MIKKERGITLISLLIIIVVMGIIASTVIYISFDRFEANNLKKMYNDIEVLADKVSNYNLKYGGLPVLRDSSNTPIIYTYSFLNFEKNSADNGIYYILDLKAMGDLALNYGGIGYENPNTSDDVYIINEASHHIYYVRGIELNNKLYHTIMKDDGQITDIIPPSSPEIKVISGIEESKGLYITPIDVEIIPGKDNWSGILETSYSIDSGYYNYLNTEDNIFNISENGSHTIKAITYDDAGNASRETVLTVTVHIEHVWDNGTVTLASTCTTTGVMTYKCTLCSETKTEPISARGHRYGAYVVTKAATCGATGSRTRTCTVCGHTQTETIPKTGQHSWDGGVITVQPYKCKNGEKTYTCTICNATKTETILATGSHSEIQYDGGDGTPATCESEGTWSGTCGVCGSLTSGTIPALGHSSYYKGGCEYKDNEYHTYKTKCGVCHKVVDEYDGQHYKDQNFWEYLGTFIFGYDRYKYKCEACKEFFTVDEPSGWIS